MKSKTVVLPTKELAERVFKEILGFANARRVKDFGATELERIEGNHYQARRKDGKKLDIYTNGSELHYPRASTTKLWCALGPEEPEEK